MSISFELKIIKPTESKNLSVLWIDVEGLEGSFIIGPNHDDIVSILKPKGRLVYKTDQNLEVEMDVFGGAIHFADNVATIILDS